MADANPIPLDLLRALPLEPEELRARIGDAFLLVHAADLAGKLRADAATDPLRRKRAVDGSAATLSSMVILAVRRRKEGADDWISLGRTEDNDLQLNHASVSRRHARFRVAAGRVAVLDTRSANGTFVHDAEVPQQGEPVSLAAGQRVRFGEVTAVFLDAAGLVRVLRGAR